MPLADQRAAVWSTRQRRITAQAQAQAIRTWRTLDRSNLTGSWNAGLGAYMKTVLVTAQVHAAAGATSYASAIIADAGLTPRPLGVVNPAAFAGTAADGRALDSLLYLPVIGVKQAIGAGAPLDVAMQAGLATLLMYVGTEIADAGREAAQVAGTADEQIIGYVRYLDATACDRCIVLAGRLYTHNEGFERHPQDGCDTRPITQSEWDEHGSDVTDSPTQAIAARSDEQLAQAGLSEADIQALRDGADPGQVINAHDGVYTVGDQTFTHSGGRGARLTVTEVYRQAGDDRRHAIDLLTQFGYIR